MEAYLDIETTGLSPEYCEITVVGIHLVGKYVTRTVQLVGDEVNLESLLDAIRNVEIIYTYNGSRFDLPFIDRRLGVHLGGLRTHRDLMYDCWRHNLYGGLKNVERQLGINRRLPDVNGFEAIRLWRQYVNNYDENALAVLLEYNREDVENLKILKEKLLTG